MHAKYLSIILLGMLSYPAYTVDVLLTKPSENIKPYRYIYKNNTLKSVLTNYARDYGLQLNLSKAISNDKLNITLSGGFSVAKPEELLDMLALQYGFNWFTYSGKLYITSNAVETDSASVAAENMQNVKTSLIQSGLYLSKFGYSELSYENKIIISGPREYLNLVMSQLNQMNIKGASQELAIFKLKYANADDLILNFNNQQVVVPGVATILKGLVQGNNSTGASSSKISLSNKVSQELSNKSSTQGDSSADSSSDAQVTNTVIQADRRLNAVIIRDKSPNLPIYKKLISDLDQSTPLIRIDVLVVKLDQTLLSQAGINWWASISGVGGIGFGSSNLSAQMQNGGTNNLATSIGSGSSGQLTSGALSNITASLQALENKKMMKTVARPSLATSDNIPASVSIVENSYINTVQNIATNSNTSQGLANGIQVNQALQITPHVIYDGDSTKIKISMILQDGSFNDLTVNPSPNTMQSTINSQTVIEAGKSIILAGYTRDNVENINSQIPLLGDIPLLGWFFKSSSKQTHNITTAYIITPEILSSNGANLNNLIIKGKTIQSIESSLATGR